MQRQRTFGRDSGLQFRMIFTMVLLGLVYGGFLALLWALGVSIIALFAIAVVLVAIQYFMSDKMVLWSMRAKEVSPQEAPKLHDMVERLSIMAGIPKPKVAISNVPIMNAFATGRDPKHAVVTVTRQIMERLSEPELEAVLAHELTHIKNRDVRVMTIASFFLMVISMLLHTLFWMSLFGGFGGGGRGRDNNQGAMVMMVVLLASVLTYFLAQLLIMALSRYRELAADRGGAIITGQPGNLASALLKLQNATAMVPDRDLREVNEGASAFFIIPALKKGSIAGLFSTHPSVEERVRRLRQMQEQMEA